MVVKYVVLVLCALSLLTSCRQSYHKPPSYFAKLIAASVRISNASGGSGSGVWIGPNEILTAAHVVSDVTNLPSLFVTVLNFGQAQVQKFDAALDLAIIVLEHTTADYIELADIPGEIGEYCAQVGYAAGLYSPTITEGLVQCLDYHGFLRYSAPGIYGNSGGGIFVRRDDEWQLLSVCQRIQTINGGMPMTHLMYGARTEDIRGFLSLGN